MKKISTTKTTSYALDPISQISDCYCQKNIKKPINDGSIVDATAAKKPVGDGPLIATGAVTTAVIFFGLRVAGMR